MDKNQKINSPRSLKACRINGVLPEELFYMDYKEYLSVHPEITNLPEDIKKYRYDLLENFRQKTIDQIKEQRNLKINNENENKEETLNGGMNKSFTKKEEEKFKINSNEQENKYHSKTFSEKMEEMINLEKKNIEKIKKKAKAEY